MEDPAPSLFYTGLVADLFAALRSVEPDPEPYDRFVRSFGTPALELGCGTGDPLLELRRRGLDVEGLDSSPDMLARCRARAEEAGIGVVLHESPIESMELGRTFGSIFLAGPTFNLLPDDAAAAAALARIASHLDPDGAALVPLFVPDPVEPAALGVPREHVRSDGVLLRVSSQSSVRDEVARTQRTVLRYELVRDGSTERTDREWLLHWHTQDGFRALAAGAGLETLAVLTAAGGPAAATDTEVAFLLRPATAG